MAYIRERSQELTGYQESAPWQPNTDVQCDFVMVYGIDSSMPERVQKFKEKGYVVHLMTGIAWGQYQDYLYGEFDGRNHWDESQMDRKGNYILHGKDVPYMSPSIVFSDYLIKKLKIAVDAGVEAIHMEEPEFWDYGGYSKAFQREYLLHYREPWQEPHSSLDVRYKASKLKAYLYARAIGRVGAALKEYAMVEYGRVLRFYIPTHSLLNYTQWKIMSPEGALIDLPVVDGYIAQVWTGTSRSANVYEGVVKERTFETAFLEYGIMQELVKGTGRRMWFLHDPIEDNPEYTWEDYRYNYLKTAVASLLHPLVSNYEICPWPRRVFDGVFPRKAGLAGGTIPTTNMPGAKAIPPTYATLLNSMVQLFGDMDQTEFSFDGIEGGIGVLMSDSGLFQRSFPDGIVGEEKIDRVEKTLREYTNRMHDGENCSEESKHFMEDVANEPELFTAFLQSGTFPNFFGMVMPLLKHGLPVRPVQLDNIRRFPGYLDDYKTLILSYEYIKPETPDVNNALAEWVKSGGALVYIGDGSDPYHKIDGWWNRAEAGNKEGKTYNNPSEHLFEMMGLPRNLKDGVTTVGNGRVMILNLSPALLCASASKAEEYRSHIKELLSLQGQEWKFTNQLTLRRGPYIISAVMDEGRAFAEEEHTFQGLFADMLENDYKIIEQKSIRQDDNTILFDFSKIEGMQWRVIGCSARILSLEPYEDGTGFTMQMKAADQIKAFVRLRLPKQMVDIKAVDENGADVIVDYSWDQASQTVLLSYTSCNQTITLNGKF
ncbi:MAG: hypothetical protein K0S47_480 [Herbinix sp.]|jgi:hypothetical protein|nr:hypothetical protein [Herbinix sp.]